MLHSEPTGTAAILQHATTLFKTDTTYDTDLDKHLHILKEHKCSLDCHGKALSDSLYSLIILASLPHTNSWNSFQAMITVSSLPLGPDILLNHILNQYHNSKKGVEKYIVCLGPPPSPGSGSK